MNFYINYQSLHHELILEALKKVDYQTKKGVDKRTLVIDYLVDLVYPAADMTPRRIGPRLRMPSRLGRDMRQREEHSILDLVIAGVEEDHIGFVRSRHRLNVARTRALDGVIIVGKFTAGAKGKFVTKQYLDTSPLPTERSGDTERYRFHWGDEAYTGQTLRWKDGLD
ncbi:MAG: hypothetical protein M1816_008279 [Peltula sp. TS41687]|nr:MAG: hypothetical protein M1816_008279 [Peltula sp. TS41687]